MHSPGKISKAIDEIGLSQQYVEKSKKMGIMYINDFLDADVPSLKMHPEFSMLWYTELLKVLQKEDLLLEFQKRL